MTDQEVLEKWWDRLNDHNLHLRRAVKHWQAKLETETDPQEIRVIEGTIEAFKNAVENSDICCGGVFPG